MQRTFFFTPKHWKIGILLGALLSFSTPRAASLLDPYPTLSSTAAALLPPMPCWEQLLAAALSRPQYRTQQFGPTLRATVNALEWFAGRSGSVPATERNNLFESHPPSEDPRWSTHSPPRSFGNCRGHWSGPIFTF